MGRDARRAFSCPFFVGRTLFIERKGVGDMRVRLYIHSNYGVQVIII